MRMYMSSILVIALLLSGCLRASSNQQQSNQTNEEQPQAGVDENKTPSLTNEPKSHSQSPLRTVKESGISFVYDTRDFGELSVEKEPKLTNQDLHKDDIPIGVAPARTVFILKDKRPLPALDYGPRYFSPASSAIEVIPLYDSSVNDFRRAYSLLFRWSRDLRKVLHNKPKSFKREIPDWTSINAGQSFHSRVQYMNFRSCSGILFLTQYSQEQTPNPVNNEELTCNFQGLTNDNRYYVSITFAITHPSLPKGIDYTEHIKRDNNWNYLKRAESELNKLPEKSFQPSLKNLKAILTSFSID